MSDEVMLKEYPSSEQRSAICYSQATEGMTNLQAADFIFSYGKNKFKYRHPNTNEYFYYSKRGVYKKDNITLILEEDDD